MQDQDAPSLPATLTSRGGDLEEDTTTVSVCSIEYIRQHKTARSDLTSVSQKSKKTVKFNELIDNEVREVLLEYDLIIGGISGGSSSEEVSGEEVSSEEVSGEEASGEEVSGEEVSVEDVNGEEVGGEEVIGEEVSSQEVSSDEVSGEDVPSEGVSSENSMMVGGAENMDRILDDIHQLHGMEEEELDR